MLENRNDKVTNDNNLRYTQLGFFMAMCDKKRRLDIWRTLPRTDLVIFNDELFRQLRRLQYCKCLTASSTIRRRLFQFYRSQRIY